MSRWFYRRHSVNPFHPHLASPKMGEELSFFPPILGGAGGGNSQYVGFAVQTTHAAWFSGIWSAQRTRHAAEKYAPFAWFRKCPTGASQAPGKGLPGYGLGQHGQRAAHGTHSVMAHLRGWKALPQWRDLGSRQGVGEVVGFFPTCSEGGMKCD